MALDYLDSVPIFVPDKNDTRHRTWSKWHRDLGTGHSTGDVVVTSTIENGWLSAHRNRAAQILGTRLIYEVGRSTMDDPLVHTRWAITEGEGWGN